MSATTTQLLSSGEFCKLRYDTIPVKSASATVSFYTNNSKFQILSCDTLVANKRYNTDCFSTVKMVTRTHLLYVYKHIAWLVVFHIVQRALKFPVYSLSINVNFHVPNLTITAGPNYRVLRRRSAAAYLLGLRVRILPGAWMFVCCEFCVSSGRGLGDELITRPEESYRVGCVVVCDLQTSRMRRL